MFDLVIVKAKYYDFYHSDVNNLFLMEIKKIFICNSCQFHVTKMFYLSGSLYDLTALLNHHLILKDIAFSSIIFNNAYQEVNKKYKLSCTFLNCQNV